MRLLVLHAKFHCRGCVGAIDGTHIATILPSKDQAIAYYDYKGNYSVIMVAIVDHLGLFRWISVGSPGSDNDSAIFRRSSLWKSAVEEVRADEARTVLPAGRPREFKKGTYLVGDKAFALTPFLMKPYFETDMRDEPGSSAMSKRYYNYLHSSTRFGVEHAFGRLKAKFPVRKPSLYCRDLFAASVLLFVVPCQQLFGPSRAPFP